MKFEDAKKEAKVSKIPKNVNIDNLSEPNIDTLTYSKAVNTNNKLATSLEVNQALTFGKYFTFVNSALKPTPGEKNTNYDKLLFTNKKILAVLEKIERNMMDEQDTSIKHNSDDSNLIGLEGSGNAAVATDGSGGFGLGINGLRLNSKGNRRGMNDGKNKGKNVSASKKSKLQKLKNKPFRELSKAERRALARERYNRMHNLKETSANKKRLSQMTAEEKDAAIRERAKNIEKIRFKRNFFPTTGRVLARGASIVGTGIIIADGVRQYVDATCDAERQDAVASTFGALGGAWAGAKLGAAIGIAGGPIGVAAGAVIGAGLGALAGSAFGEWLSGKFKTPLDFIPDKFKNRGPQVEYYYIENYLIPLVNSMPYESEAEYNKSFDAVEARMIELVEQMKKGATKEEQREWDKNGLINEGVVTDNWWFNKNSIKDWKKVETLSDHDLDILINDANLNDLDLDRVRELKFRKDASNNAEASSAVSAIDRVNQAIQAEKQRLEEYRKENTFDPFTGGEIESDNYRRSRKTIEELQQVKRTMLSQAEKGDYREAEVTQESRELNKNAEKQFNSLNIVNTSNAEFFADRGKSSKEYSEAWAKSYSSSKDISRNAIADFTSIKADTIEFNKNDHLGFLSGEFESGGNPGVIAKDNIGYAYGAWQMNSKVGLLKAFLKTLKGDERFEKLAQLEIDSPEFQNEWARVAKEYPNEFLEKQHKFIEDTKFKPVLNFARSHGLNTTNRAVQEALWSQAVQHGDKGNRIIILKAIDKLGNSNDPEKIVRALYEARAEYINGLSTLDDSLKAQIINRYKKESSKALAVIENSEFQNSEITKNVNDIETGELPNINKTLQEKLEEANSESTASKKSESDLPIVEIDKIEKRESNNMPIEDLNRNIIIETHPENTKPVETPVKKHESPDFTQWSVEPL